MNVFLSVMLILLLLVNFFAVLATNIAIDTAYKFSDLFVKSFGYCLGFVAVTCAIIIANIALAGILDESGYTGFAVLIQIVFLVINILLIILFAKINYKRNVKAYLQIKI